MDIYIPRYMQRLIHLLSHVSNRLDLHNINNRPFFKTVLASDLDLREEAKGSIICRRIPENENRELVIADLCFDFP